MPEACRVIAQGHTHRIDLGCVNGKYFFTVASLGLSVQLTRKVTRGSKRRWGMLSYAVAAQRLILQAQPFHAEILVNGSLIQVKTIQITVGNGRFYGGGLAVANDATIDDQRLDLYSLEIRHWWKMVMLPLAIRYGRYSTNWGVRTLRAKEIEIHTRSPDIIDTDGELTTQTPA